MRSSGPVPLWIPLTTVALLVSSVSAACFYPDGSNANSDYNYQPCGDSNTTFSTCCYFGEGDRCLQNGLCNNPGKHDYRAACQNKDWSNCPQVCMDSKSRLLSYWLDVAHMCFFSMQLKRALGCRLRSAERTNTVVLSHKGRAAAPTAPRS